MQTSSLRRVLSRALLVGAPFAALDCGTSSCPDNGVEPPPANMMEIGSGDYGGGPLDAAQCDEVCDLFDEGVITCVRTSPERVLCINPPVPSDRLERAHGARLHRDRAGDCSEASGERLRGSRMASFVARRA